MKKDDIYSSHQEEIKKFVFDEKVANVFEDMIDRSVPGYRDIVAMIGVLAGEYVSAGSRAYDLGCSLGAVSLVMHQAIQHQDYQIVAVDKSEAMIERCRENIAKQCHSGLDPESKASLDSRFSAKKRGETAARTDLAALSSGRGNDNITLLCEDIQNIKIEKASLVVLNFTLQFVAPEKRANLIRAIYKGMNPGGVLVVSEKICFEEKREQDFQTETHHAFKKMHGYSDLEISQKRTALENILIPETCKEHQKRFKEAGFTQSYQWFQCFNFASFLAIK